MKKSLELAISKVFPNSKIASINLFTKGHVNRTFNIKIKNPEKDLVFRIFPNDSWKAEKEQFLYDLISKKTDVKVPQVYKVDTSKKIISHAYSIMSKIKGTTLDKAYKKAQDKKLIERAGETLAKIHSIKFGSFGWIVNKKVHPRFRTWHKFIHYDLEEKLKKLSKSMLIEKEHIFKCHKRLHDFQTLLKVRSKPCLLHKDYHFPHIIIDKGGINGIIDMEWATAGHNELDIAKSEWWMFDRLPRLKPYFLKGYQRFGSVSKEYKKRKEMYEIILLISSIAFSYEMKNKRWLAYNVKKIKTILERC